MQISGTDPARERPADRHHEGVVVSRPDPPQDLDDAQGGPGFAVGTDQIADFEFTGHVAGPSG